MRLLQWRLKDFWSPMLDDPALPVPVSPECAEALRWWVLDVPLQVPPPSLLLHTDTSLSVWGAHLLDLMAAGVWSASTGGCRRKGGHLEFSFRFPLPLFCCTQTPCFVGGVLIWISRLPVSGLRRSSPSISTSLRSKLSFWPGKLFYIKFQATLSF